MRTIVTIVITQVFAISTIYHEVCPSHHVITSVTKYIVL